MEKDLKNDPLSQSGSNRAGPRPTPRRLNVGLLSATLLVVAIGAPVVYFWRAHQLRNVAITLLSRADYFQEKEEWRSAADYIHRYVRLRPKDHTARIRLAEVYDKSAKTLRQKARAVDLYYLAIGVASDAKTTELRDRLAQLLLEQGRFEEAEMQANRILEWDEGDQKGQRHKAKALFGLFRSRRIDQSDSRATEVGQAFATAVTPESDDIALLEAYARIFREYDALLCQDDKESFPTLADRQHRADRLMHQIVEKSDDHDQAYLSRFLYRTRYKLPNAEADLWKALREGGENLSVRQAAGDHERRTAQKLETGQFTAEQLANASVGTTAEHYERAVEHFRNIVEKIDPRNETAYLSLGETYLARNDSARNDLERSAEALRDGLKYHPNSLPLSTRLVETLLAQNELGPAETALNKLDETSAEFSRHLNLGVRLSLQRTVQFLRADLLVRKENYFSAIQELQKATYDKPETDFERQQAYQAWMLRGRAYWAVRHWDLSALAFEKGANLRPNFAGSYIAAAAAWTRGRRWDRAGEKYGQALSLERITPRQTVEASLAVGRVRLIRQMQLPPTERKWELVERALQQARTHLSRMAPRENKSIENTQTANAPTSESDGSSFEAWRIDLLEADLAANRADAEGEEQRRTKLRDGARKTLIVAEAQFPDSDRLTQHLVLAYQRLGFQPDADRLLTRLQNAEEKTVENYLTQSRLYALRNENAQAQTVLQQGVETLPLSSATPLHLAWAQRSLEMNRLAEAYDRLKQSHRRDPANLELTRQLVELALQSRDFQEVQKLEGRLKRIAGEGGFHWRYYKARRLLAQTDTPEKSVLRAVNQYAQDLRRRRPHWPAASLLMGLLEEKRGNPEQAVQAYRRAIDLGERRLFVYERVFRLLFNMNRLAEAEEFLAHLKNQPSESTDLQDLEIALLAQKGEFARGVDLARRRTKQRPDDPLARVWLGQMLLLADDKSQAEQAFQEARRIAPQDVRVWNGLFSFYLRTEQHDQARRTLSQMVENAALSPRERSFVLAQGYDLLGDRSAAQAEYANAEQAAPQDPKVLLQRAVFQLKSDDAAAAEETLRRVLKISPQNGKARRTLAAVYANRGGDKNFREAMKLLEDDRATDLSTLDRRLQAVLLAGRGGDRKTRLEALERAEDMIQRILDDGKETTAGDRLLLAKILEDQSRLSKEDYRKQSRLRDARDQYLQLVAGSSPDPSHVAVFLDFLMRNGFHDQTPKWLHKHQDVLKQQAKQDPTHVAQLLDLRLRLGEAGSTTKKWLKTLLSIEPDTLRTTSLRIRWLQQTQRTGEIKAIVEPFAKKVLSDLEEKNQRAQLYLKVGDLYSLVNDHAAAEIWYRRLVDAAPNRYESLALCMARQSKTALAMKLCEAAPEVEGSPKKAIAMSMVLTVALADETKLASGRKWIEAAQGPIAKALQLHPRDSKLLFAVACLRMIERRPSEAIRLYENAIQIDPDHVLTLNNLATLLGESEVHREKALRYIDRAIELAGPLPSLYDTKGVILLHEGKALQAVELLETAVKSPNPDPRIHFHLALAYHRAGQLKEAGATLQLARRRHLEKQLLTPQDKKLLGELQEKLKNQSP